MSVIAISTSTQYGSITVNYLKTKQILFPIINCTSIIRTNERTKSSNERRILSDLQVIAKIIRNILLETIAHLILVGSYTLLEAQ